MKKMAAARDQRREISMSSEDESSPVSGDLRRGPWTVEEDLLLVNYIAAHGEGRWNALARGAGLKRTGKSCRLRWLNYLRPDLRRGNMTAQEQLLILELHSRWGNRWSKIAQHLPGRTDNEIKNYWRTRVQKHARQLNCDVNSQQFKDLMRYLWMPRLLERINNSSSSSLSDDGGVLTPPPPPPQQQLPVPAAWSADDEAHLALLANNEAELSSSATAASSSSVSTDGVTKQQQPLVSNAGDWSSCYQPPQTTMTGYPLPAATHQFGAAGETCWSDEVYSPAGLSAPAGVVYGGDMAAWPDLGETMWGTDDLWYTQIMGCL